MDLKRLRDPLQVHLPLRQIGEKIDLQRASESWQKEHLFKTMAFLIKALQVEAGSHVGVEVFNLIKKK